MLIKEFPNIVWLKKQIRENFQDRKAVDGILLKHPGWPNVVLNTKAKNAERKDIKGPFSLFLNLRGSSQVTIEGKRLDINEQCYTLSNDGQYYDLLINNDKPTETFNIHFGTQFYQKAIYALTHDANKLLDMPFEALSEEWNLGLHTRALDANCLTKLRGLKAAYEQGLDTYEEEELLFEVLSMVLSDCSEEIKRQQLMPFKSQAVKEEVTQRLYVARDFLHAHYDENLSLDVLAKISCLSKFHFLRMFKALFKCTPYQYQKQLRFQKASDLYRLGLSLEQIAPMIGMENASSVSRMFHKQAGVYPSQLVYE